jgi:RNA-directed DNA polymerase
LIGNGRINHHTFCESKGLVCLDCHRRDDKIERGHEEPHPARHYDLPGNLEWQIATFVEHYNYIRYHESIDNLMPTDVYFGRSDTILAERQRIERDTIENHRFQHRLQASQILTLMSQRRASQISDQSQII